MHRRLCLVQLKILFDLHSAREFFTVYSKILHSLFGSTSADPLTCYNTLSTNPTPGQ